jgi:hypothetical protein
VDRRAGGRRNNRHRVWSESSSIRPYRPVASAHSLCEAFRFVPALATSSLGWLNLGKCPGSI